MIEQTNAPTAEWARRYVDEFALALVPIDPGEKAPKGMGWNKLCLLYTSDAADE